MDNINKIILAVLNEPGAYQDIIEKAEDDSQYLRNSYKGLIEENENMEKMMSKKDKLPKFDGGIVLVFPKTAVSSRITALFGKHTRIHTYDDILEMTYVEVKNLCCWEVNDLLTELFLQCNFEVLTLAQDQLDARVIVDITFQHYERYPSLLFNGENMARIHMLKADISIDAY